MFAFAGIEPGQGINGTKTDDCNQQTEAAEYSQHKPRCFIVDHGLIDKAKINHNQADAEPDGKIEPANIAFYLHNDTPSQAVINVFCCGFFFCILVQITIISLRA